MGRFMSQWKRFCHRSHWFLELSRFYYQDLGNGLITEFMSLYIHQSSFITTSIMSGDEEGEAAMS